ncbi:MAG: AsmA family protein, partial [Hyphomicrobiaceae bacterium]|nr:AsmA family protein [Hyphomicrobiaceae bacterium]
MLVAPPVEAVRDRLAAEVKSRTGRTLTVTGPMSVALFPRVVVAFSDVNLLPPDGMTGAPTLTAPSIDVETSLWSLVSRRPRLERVTLQRPTIELAIDPQGRRSWETAAPRPRPEVPPADQALPSAEASDLTERLSSVMRPKSPVASLSITPTQPRQPRPWAVRLVDGTVRYRDERAGTTYEIGALNVDLAAEAAAGAVTMDGTFGWHGETFHFSAATVAAPIDDRRSQHVRLTLSGAPLELSYAGKLAWSGAIAAEGVLALQRLDYKNLKIGPVTFGVKADAGVVELAAREAQLYGGRGQGELTLDIRGPVPAVSARLKLADVALLPLLKDTAGVGWLDGRGAVALDLGAQGASERQIVETLQGQVKVSVAEGAVTGIDIDRSMRALQRGQLGGLAPRREDRTPFSALASTFQITNGVAKSQDLKLDSAHLEVRGEGQIELGPRRINYTLHTKITGGEADEGATIKIGTIELPITVIGPLERPKFGISGQEGLSDAINQIGKKLRSRDVQGALKGLFGGDGPKAM